MAGERDDQPEATAEEEEMVLPPGFALDIARARGLRTAASPDVRTTMDVRLSGAVRADILGGKYVTDLGGISIEDRGRDGPVSMDAGYSGGYGIHAVHVTMDVDWGNPHGDGRSVTLFVTLEDARALRDQLDAAIGEMGEAEQEQRLIDDGEGFRRTVALFESFERDRLRRLEAGREETTGRAKGKGAKGKGQGKGE